MAQTVTAVASKSTGDRLTATEINDINTTVNENSADAESRLADIKSNTTGWGYYQDSSGTDNISTGFQKFEIDGAGLGTNTNHLPTGVSSFWDASNQVITPDNAGDAYLVKVDFRVTSRSDNQNGTSEWIEFSFDSAEDADGNTNRIFNTKLDIHKSNFYYSVVATVFADSDFFDNGCGIFARTSYGLVATTDRAVTILRVSKG